MGTIPTTTNAAATAVDTAIAKAVTAGETVVTGLIVADIAAWTGPMAPVTAWLVNFFIKPLVSPLVSYVGGKFSIALQDVGTFTVIDVQVADEESNLKTAAAAVQTEGGTTDAIQQAIQAEADAQSALVHDDGSAKPSS